MSVLVPGLALVLVLGLVLVLVLVLGLGFRTHKLICVVYSCVA